MPNFVEQATLEVIDRSSSKIKKINNELRALHRVGRSLGIFPQLSRGNVAIRKQIGLLGRLRSARSSVGGVPAAANSFSRGNRGFGGRGGVDQRFPGNLGRATNRVFAYSTGFELYQAARGTVRQAGRGVLEDAGETSTQRFLGLTTKQVEELGKAATEASKGMLAISETEARATARNALLAGATNETLAEVVKAQLEVKQAAKPLLGAEQADRLGERITKLVDLAGKLDRPGEASKIVRAFGQAQLVAGRDLSFQQVLTAFRNSAGLIMGMSTDALQDFTFAVEESGRRASQGLRSFDRELNASNVDGKTIRKLENAGLRLKGGGAVDAELQSKDFTKWIEKNIIPKLSAKGVDLDSLNEVRQGIAKFGFNQSGTSFLTAEVLKREERKRARQRAKNIKFDKIQEVASKDLGLAAQFVAEQFKDLAKSKLGGLASGTAQFVLTPLAKLLDKLSREDSGLLGIAGVGGAAGIAGLATAAFKSPILTANTTATWSNTRALRTNTLSRRAKAGGALAFPLKRFIKFTGIGALASFAVLLTQENADAKIREGINNFSKSIADSAPTIAKNLVIVFEEIGKNFKENLKGLFPRLFGSKETDEQGNKKTKTQILKEDLANEEKQLKKFKTVAENVKNDDSFFSKLLGRRVFAFDNVKSQQERVDRARAALDNFTSSAEGASERLQIAGQKINDRIDTAFGLGKPKKEGIDGVKASTGKVSVPSLRPIDSPNSLNLEPTKIEDMQVARQLIDQATGESQMAAMNLSNNTNRIETAFSSAEFSIGQTISSGGLALGGKISDALGQGGDTLVSKLNQTLSQASIAVKQVTAPVTPDLGATSLASE